MSDSVYQIVTDRMVEKMKQGEIPWHKPWFGGNAPINLISNKPYRGINVWLLAGLPFASPYFLSFKQCESRGGKVIKGQKSNLVVFYTHFTTKEVIGTNSDGSTKFKTFPVLRYYNVFNVEQCEGLKNIPQVVPNNEFTPIEICDRMIINMPSPPQIAYDEARAVYYIASDKVVVPKMSLFNTAEEFYTTMFHELVHSTGHKSRLNRPEITKEGVMEKDSYSKEELVAEMGAAFLANICGIGNVTFDNSVAYVQGWMKRIADDNKLIVRAASQAQRAADFIQGKLIDTNSIPQEKEDTQIEEETIQQTL